MINWIFGLVVGFSAGVIISYFSMAKGDVENCDHEIENVMNLLRDANRTILYARKDAEQCEDDLAACCELKE